MIDQIKDIWENGNEEERVILSLAVQSIRQKRERNSAFISGFLGLKGEFLDEKTYQFLVPVTPFMHNPLGIVHGGITATILDSTMGSMINRLLAPDDQYSVTSEIKIHYIRAVKTGTLRSEATILHRGQTLIICQGSIFDEKDKLVAHATGTFVVLKQKGE